MNPEPEQEAEPKRGRPPGAKTRKRRNFAAELADLQGRADTAVRLLRKVIATDACTTAMIQVAIETLTGEQP